ncbi:MULTISPECIES: cysteine desulfurase family protein [unclassified Ruminococcus]|nr:MULTISPECIES: cysteine desulfurase family protein [unclassified Ruminococcus]MDB8755598.1 cysteine desulfurase family protein [Ruminococcus sp. 1001136sp1]MDB8759754.1 cysteine desulfurase family protein [Ruminococcus sp. 1001136sp1]MDB8767838.1 cysteine desulfurase family protein [Ruminococcus sp. 1001136sp1]
MPRIYADNAATTKISQTAMKAMISAMENSYGNPSSIHQIGMAANDALQTAREQIACCLGCMPKEIFFTSGGTESDNQAIMSAAMLGAEQNKRHIISTAFEHHAVLHTLRRLKEEGFEIQLLDVGAEGNITAAQVEEAIRPDTCLVTVMFANNEIGSVLPIAEIGEVCRAHGVLFHTDAVQAAGHIPVNVKKQNIDMLSLSAHKFHGPRGIGALYVKRGIELTSLMEGGGQERGKRPGTENLPAIMGMAAALKEECTLMEQNEAKVIAMRDRLIQGLSQIPYSILNGSREKRLPGNVNFCFEGVSGESLLLLLDSRGICASSGSACASGALDPSHVLLSLGLAPEIAQGSLRISLDISNTEEEIDYMLEVIPQVVEQLRGMSDDWRKKHCED